jgi:hypothetical protein
MSIGLNFAALSVKLCGSQRLNLFLPLSYAKNTQRTAEYFIKYNMKLNSLIKKCDIFFCMHCCF